MGSWLRAHGTTAAATIIAGALVVVFGSIAVQALLGAADPDRLSGSFERNTLLVGGESADAAAAAAIIGVVIAAVTLVAAIPIVGWILRRQWAREAGMVIYAVLGLVATAAGVTGAFSDPPARAAGWGIVAGLAAIAVAVLLWLPATKRDFSNREMERVVAARTSADPLS